MAEIPEKVLQNLESMGDARRSAYLDSIEDPIIRSAMEQGYDEYKTQKGVGIGTSAFEGIKHGATFGFAGEIAGLSGALGAMSGGSKEPFWDTFEQAKKEYEGEEEQAHRAHPTAYGAGEFGGSALTGAVLPAAGASKLGQAAFQGAEVGGLYGAGESKADLVSGNPKEIGKFLVDTGTGTVLGAGTGVVTHGVLAGAGAVKRKVAEKAGNLANWGAAKAAGIVGTEEGAVQEAGKTIRKEGLLKARDIINPTKSVAENISERAESILENEANPEVAKAVRAVQARATGDINKTELADYIEAEVLPKLDEHAQQDQIAVVKKYTNSLRESPTQDVSFERAVEHKRALGKEAYPPNKELQKYQEEPELAKGIKAKQETYESMRGSLEKSASEIAPEDEAARYVAANERASKLQSVRKVSAREAVHSRRGLPISALSLKYSAVRNILHQRGPGAASIAAGVIEKAMGGSAEEAATARLLANNPKALGQFRKALISAAASGEEEFSQAVSDLIDNPEYQRIIKKNKRK